MRLYLDTNILAFFATGEEDEINADVEEMLRDYENSLLTSSVCIHELIHLFQIGKIHTSRRGSLPDVSDFDSWLDDMGVRIMPVTMSHLREYASLPILDDHRDPQRPPDNSPGDKRPRATDKLRQEVLTVCEVWPRLRFQRKINGFMVSKASDTKEKDKQRRDKLSGYFLDMSKLTFGATVLSGVLPTLKNATASDAAYTIAGMIGTVWLYMIGRNILK